MKVIFYILAPICAFVLNIFLGAMIPLVTIPVTWVINKFDKNPNLYKFRFDMVIQGIIRGFLVITTVEYLNIYFKMELSYWWIVITTLWLSHLSISAWDKNKPEEYEISLNVSPILGFLIGLIYIY
jgi:hypothetical protein